jgi:hypothetical protein
MAPTMHTCKNCGHHFEAKYCNECGEKLYQEKDRKIVYLFDEALHFITHFEGSFFTTLKAIFTKPGLLSSDYCNGTRKRYFKPLSLFLLLVVLYLLFPLASGLNMPLDYHMEHGRYGEFATAKVQAFLTAHPDKSFTSIQQQFAAKSEKMSKILLLLIIPCCALVLWAISFFRRRLFFDQMVISAEINSFFLITNFFLLPLLIMLIQTVSRLLHISFAWLNDDIYTFTGQVLTAIFAAWAFKRFYGFGVVYRVIAAGIFIYFHGLIVYSLYKFVLFATVFYQIH